MKIFCAPSDIDAGLVVNDLRVVLYDISKDASIGSAGASIVSAVGRKKLHPSPRAWDFLSIALAITAADLSSPRTLSPDGWTRQFEISIAVVDPAFWTTQIPAFERLLAFLTNDLWHIGFVGHGFLPAPNKKPIYPEEDSVALLSGGLDSFTGVMNLNVSGQKPMAVSHTVRGDAQIQRELAQIATGGGAHLQLNHNAQMPGKEASSPQRARSLIFIAYAVLGATTLARYHAGKEIPLYVCENGFISINPPLTPARLGSLSTRTTHPVVLTTLQQIFDAAGLRTRIANPCSLITKGEMLVGSADQPQLRAHAHRTTSCGRYQHYGYTHCGRCVPCLVRRAAFHHWGVPDTTKYVFADLSRDDRDHMRFDDVRSAAMAIESAKLDGIEHWLGAILSSDLIDKKLELKRMVQRGLAEIDAFLATFAVQ